MARSYIHLEQQERALIEAEGDLRSSLRRELGSTRGPRRQVHVAGVISDPSTPTRNGDGFSRGPYSLFPVLCHPERSASGAPRRRETSVGWRSRGK
jgi:hypothetical protein